MTVRSLKKGTINNLAADNTSVAVPTQPVITGVTAKDTGTQVDVALTFPAIGASATNYTVTSTPGSLTATGNSSPLTVNGLTPNTNYNFTAKATGNLGDGPTTGASSTIKTNSAYILLSTITSSTTYTVPEGVSKITVFATGGGAGGNPGGSSGTSYSARGGHAFTGSGGNGANSSAIAGFTDYAVTPGQNFTVNIGAGGNASSNGGTTSFGNLLTVVGNTVNSSGITPTTATNATTLTNIWNGGNGPGTGGGAGQPTVNAGQNVHGAVNNTPNTVSFTLTGLGATALNQSNGGGGGGGASTSTGTWPTGSGGISNIGGGSGGSGGSSGAPGGTGNLRGSGGGGGGGAQHGGGGAGGAGAGGAVYIYGLY